MQSGIIINGNKQIISSISKIYSFIGVSGTISSPPVALDLDISPVVENSLKLYFLNTKL
jgi:hypothetical protein